MVVLSSVGLLQPADQTGLWCCRWWWFFVWAFLQPILCGWIAVGPPVVGNWAAGGFTMISQFADNDGEAPFLDLSSRTRRHALSLHGASEWTSCCASFVRHCLLLIARSLPMSSDGRSHT